jgi:hypothetical protein
MKKNLDLKGYEYPEKMSSREKTALVIIIIVMIAFTLTSCSYHEYDCAAHYHYHDYYSGRITPRYKLAH